MIQKEALLRECFFLVSVSKKPVVEAGAIDSPSEKVAEYA
jgi:hypothetical protein